MARCCDCGTEMPEGQTPCWTCGLSFPTEKPADVDWREAVALLLLAAAILRWVLPL